MTEKLYHGTCKAFTTYADQQNGLIGALDGLRVTSSYEHARMFAEA